MYGSLPLLWNWSATSALSVSLNLVHLRDFSPYLTLQSLCVVTQAMKEDERGSMLGVGSRLGSGLIDGILSTCNGRQCHASCSSRHRDHCATVLYGKVGMV